MKKKNFQRRHQSINCLEQYVPTLLWDSYLILKHHITLNQIMLLPNFD